MLDFTLDLCFCFAFFKESGWSCPSPTFSYRAGVLYFGKLLILQMLSKLKKPMSGLQSIWAKCQIVKDACNSFFAGGASGHLSNLVLDCKHFAVSLLDNCRTVSNPMSFGGGGLHITIKIIFVVFHLLLLFCWGRIMTYIQYPWLPHNTQWFSVMSPLYLFCMGSGTLCV